MANYFPGSYRGSYAARFLQAPSTNPMDSVTKDATSGKYCPANAAEWAIVLAAAGMDPLVYAPSALWLSQEASGSLSDSIGSFPLTAANTPTYAQGIAGWSRKGVVLDNASADGFSTSSASLPDLSSQSQLVIAYMRFPSAAPAASRSLLSMGGAGTRASANITSTPRTEGRIVANASTGTVNPCDGLVHPVVLRVNRTLTETDVMTDTEKVSAAWSSVVSGKGMLIGNGPNPSADCALLLAASFHLSAAEMADLQIKSLLQTLGWTVLW